MEIEDDFGINLPQGSFDRLMVARNLLTTDDFYRSLPDFVQWCGVLNGDTYDPLLWDPADAQEVAWGISEALIIEPPDEEEPFNSEIRAYIGAVLDEEGIMNAPDILRLALRNVDLTAKVHGDFSDDPIMFAAIYGFEKSKTDDINNYTRGQLRLLISQLEQLPLRLGETNGVVQRAVQMLS
jgi:acyl carrier protein